MKNECIFKCQFGGHCFRVFVAPHPRRDDDVIFFTFMDRRRLDPFTWNSFEGAIGSIMQEHPEFDCKKFGEVWK